VLLQDYGQAKNQQILRNLKLKNNFRKNKYKIEHYSSIELKYLISQINFMCEMIDEIEIEHLRMALARARKETNPQPEEEKPLAVVAQ